MHQELLTFQSERGLSKITAHIASVVAESGEKTGLVNVFCQHTSCSLLLNEGADSDVVVDLENWLSRLVKEDDSLYTHTYEGSDDMPAHIKTALTQSSLTIPVVNGKLGLGTWQHIFLWEHRNRGGKRSVVVTVNKN